MPSAATLPVRVEHDPANPQRFRLYDNDGSGVTVLADGTLAVLEGGYTQYSTWNDAAAVRDAANAGGSWELPLLLSRGGRA